MYTKVLRSGHINAIRNTEIVPGDIICFEIGDRIAADGRLIEANYLSTDDSSIFDTRESTEKTASTIEEDVPVNKRINMVYMGSMVVAGSGKAIVTAIGKQTQIARKTKHHALPPQNSMIESEISRKGLWFALICVILSLVLGTGMVLLELKYTGELKYTDGIVLCLSFLIALWPMGIMGPTSMALTNGIDRLGKLKVIIRKFAGAERLASLTCICTNKKGILTENRMTAKKLFVDGHIIDVDEDINHPDWDEFVRSSEEENPDLSLLLTIACMSTNTEVKNTTEGWMIDGDAVEGELIITALKGGVNKDEVGLSLTKLADIPYDAERKRFTAILKDTSGDIFVFTRGILESILDISDDMQLHGYVDNLDIGRLRAIWAVNHNFATDFMQTIAFAYRKLKAEPDSYTSEFIERDMIFVGMLGLVDPPRADTKNSVEKSIACSIKPILFTEDSEDTALSFAQNVSIAQSESEILGADDLDGLTEKKFFDIYDRFSVYADISPSHKSRIIKALNENGETTAMIGESVYDVVAIKQADIGIAKGQTASSVCVEASDMVLMDGSFSSAVSAIENMRTTYVNIKKVIRYFLSGSIAMATTLLITMIISIFWKDIPFPPLSLLHILWINTFAICIPSIAIAFRPSIESDMFEMAHSTGKIINGELKSNIFIRGIFASIFALIAYFYSFSTDRSMGVNYDRAMTEALTILFVSQLAFAFQCCANNKGFFSKFISNRLLLILFIVSVLIHLAIIYVPFANNIFGTKPLSLVDWIPIVAAFAIFSIPFDELFTTHVEYEEKKPLTEEKEMMEEDNDEK